MKKPLVSIIVPVYRAEKYLDFCIQSILRQTYDNIEVILVDDGSDDKCPEICEKYATLYKNITVIHQVNKGVSAARNVGLELANGEYIQFCDSDDELKPELIEKAVWIAQENCSEVLMFGYETFPDGNIVLPTIDSGLYENITALISKIKTWHSGNQLCFNWRFFFKAKFLDEHNIRFDESILFGEDVLFDIIALCEAERIWIEKDALYKYRIDNVTSIMRTRYKPNLEYLVELQYEKKIELSEKYGLNKDDDWMSDMAFYYIKSFADMLFKNAMNGPKADKKAAIKRIICMPAIRDNFRRYLKYGGSLTRCGRKNAIFWILCMAKVDWIVYGFVVKNYTLKE